MGRTLEFTIPGDVDTLIRVEEVLNTSTGLIELRFDVTVDETNAQADLRGLFFDVSDASLLTTLSATGADVTDEQFSENKVKDLGNGANMNGSHVKKNAFDAGIEFGTSGQSKDDIDATSFTLASGGGDLSLDLIAEMRFGLRYTSVGPEGSRKDSLKLVGQAPEIQAQPPVAVDDAVSTDEDSPVGLQILANDSDPDNDPLTVISSTAGPLGAPVAVLSDQGRIGQVTVEADGTVSFDPLDAFQDLGTGETDTVEFDYTISDGNGGTDTATVTITVDGANDAPVGQSDGPFFVESGDSLLADVLSNDTDVDSAIDPASLIFNGALHGSAANTGGALDYQANDIGGDTIDDSVADTFTYMVSDTEGAQSGPTSVTVNVIDPLLETDSVVSAAALNGQSLGLSMATEDRTYNDSSIVALQIDAGSLTQEPLNVSFVLDGSGSVGAPQYGEQLQSVQNAIDQLRSNFAGTGAQIDVQLVQFSRDAFGGTFDLFDTALDDITTGTPLTPYLNGYGTDFDKPLSLASDFFSTRTGEQNFLLFTSDGERNSGYKFDDEVAELNDFGVSITAVGFGGGVSLATLNTIDNTGGAQIVATAAELGDVFLASPLFPADLIEFKLEVDGVDQGFGVADLTDLGGGDYGFVSLLTGLDHDLGDTNDVVATAGFDVDNDGLVDEIRSVQTVINGTDGSDILFA